MRKWRFSKWVTVVLVCLLAVSLLAGCSNSTKQASNTPKKTELTILAASSLKDVMGELQTAYASKEPNVTLRVSLAGSGDLEQQIANGAPADLFISAATKNMNNLQQKNLLESGTDKDLLGNSVVLVVPANGSSAVTDFNSLAKASVKKIAIGDPASAPCGVYTEQVFKTLGLTDKLKSKLVPGKDVKAVLTYVEGGNVDAGVVYTSDAKTSDKVKVVATADDSSHDPIVYPVAVIKGSKNLAAAKAFEDFLFSDQAKTIYQKYDFPVKF